MVLALRTQEGRIAFSVIPYQERHFPTRSDDELAGVVSPTYSNAGSHRAAQTAFQSHDPELDARKSIRPFWHQIRDLTAPIYQVARYPSDYREDYSVSAIGRSFDDPG